MDTTSTGLTFTLYHLLARPNTWRRLCEEVRSRFESPDEITVSATSLLPYLDAVVHEGTDIKCFANSQVYASVLRFRQFSLA